jgi:ABC-type multidrug transport system fused ATPase/permease subunit
MPLLCLGDGFGYIVGPGFFFAIASIFRFYSLSYMIGDVRLAQTLYFYGSIALVFILMDIYFSMLFITASGDITNSTVQSLGWFFSFLDPTFGWYLILLFQNNFLGILTQNSDSTFWSSNIAGINLVLLLIGAIFYTLLFIVVTENAFGGCCKRVGSAALEINTTTDGSATKKGTGKGSNERGRRTMIATEDNGTNSFFNNIVADPLNLGMASTTTSKDKKPGKAVRAAANESKVQRSENALAEERSFSSLDPDVKKEREKVKRIVERGIVNREESAIFINNLRKVYFARGSVPAKVAVKNINLSIPQGEIFGLLGANGKK